MEYKKDEIVQFARKSFRVISCNKRGFTGNEYDLEAMLPNKNGQFDKHIRIPEGYISLSIKRTHICQWCGSAKENPFGLCIKCCKFPV